MSFLSNILALLPDNISKRIKPVDLRNSFEYVYADMAKLQEDRVLTIGTITATTTTLTLALHTSGVNSVLMSGVERSKTEGDDFTFAPVSAGKLKYVLLYALPDPQLFHIIEGVEGNEAIYPDLPPGALLIKAVLISEFGALLEDADGGYKPLAEDPWRNIVINSNAAVNIIVASSPSASFNVLVGAGVTAPKIAAIKTKVKKNTRDGQEITFYNDSDTPLALLAGDYEETLVYTTFPFADNYEIKPRSFAKFKRKENKYHELAGGGSASFPEGAAPGDVLTEGTEGPEWSNRLTNAENEIDAEVVERALADNALQAQITAEKNRNDTQDGQITANANAISLKIDKPTILVPNTEYLVGLDLNGDSTKISAGDLSFTSAFFTWNLTYMIPHSGTTYSTLKTGNPSLVGASSSPERLSKAIRFSSSGATIAFQRGGVMLISTNSGIGTIELITQRKFLVETNINTQRVFVGISNNYGTTNPGNSDFSTLINTVGVILRESSPNWQFIHNNATGAPVITDTGLSHSSTHSFTWYFTIKGGVQKIILEKQSLVTGVKEIAETTLTKFSHEVLYFHALFCIDKDETSPVRMLDFGAIMQTKGFFL